MTKKLSQKIAAILLFVLAAALLATGVFGMSQRVSDSGQALLSDMRVRALLTAMGEGLVDSYVEIAREEARTAAREAGLSLAQRTEMIEKAVEEARAAHTASEVDLTDIDTEPLKAAIVDLQSALAVYNAQVEDEQRVYIEQMREQLAAEQVEEGAQSAADLSAESGSEDIEAVAEVDMSGFVPSTQAAALLTAADAQYTAMGAVLTGIYPVLDDAALMTLKSSIMDLLSRPGDDYAAMFDRFAASGGERAIEDNIWQARVIRYADDLITVGIALLVAGSFLIFLQALVKGLGVPRLIIGLFFVLLCVLSQLYDLSLTSLLSNAIVRTGMNAILVLAMVPGIQSGIGLNLGLPIGIVGGLLGGLLCIEFGFSGWPGFLFAIAVGSAISVVTGYLYGQLLNRLKGNEMAVTTYVGMSVISLMCIAWLTLPFTALEMRWPLGSGLRNTILLKSSFRHILNNQWAFWLGSFRVPTGLLLFMALCCFLMWLFNRSRTGIAMQAAGNNPRFAEATGVNVDKMRIVGTILSTVLGAIGILVFSQSYGFMQLYTAPEYMGFVAASAVLIGGASTSRSKISHVIIGTFLFQGVLTLGMPVANALVPGSTIAETMRILISNGIILYALTKSGGDTRA